MTSAPTPDPSNNALRAAACAGDPLAQYLWAGRLWTGEGVRRGPKQAREWMARAADKGHRLAINDYGVMWLDGDGGPQNLRRARALFERSAELGEPLSYFNLGEIYEKGTGVRPNFKLAAHWYEKAAKAGDTDAMMVLAHWYMWGSLRGVPIDLKRARRYLNLAAERGECEAMLELARQLVSGQHFKEDWKAAGEWYRLAAELGSVEAAFALGGAYEHGQLGFKKHIGRARTCYVKAAEGGNADAAYTVAYFLMKGNGEARDFKGARHWLEQAVRYGNDLAELTLGTFDELGLAGPVDLARALSAYKGLAKRGYEDARHFAFWLAHADSPGVVTEIPAERPESPAVDVADLRSRARQGDTAAMTQLGRLMARGEAGVRREPAHGKGWLEKAAALGHAAALTELGALAVDDGPVADAPEHFLRAYRYGDAAAARRLSELYDGGLGVEQSSRLALNWLRRAAKGGDPEAITRLADHLLWGWGCRKDLTESKVLLEFAAKANYAPAMLNLAQYYGQGAFNANSEATVADGATAIEWYRRAHDAGSVDATKELANISEWGLNGRRKDLRAARRYYVEAARRGDAAAMTVAGRLCLFGIGGPPDPPTAAAWLLRAAAKDESEALGYLGAMVEHGLVFKRDNERAYDYYRRANALGETTSGYRLFFLTGEGEPDIYGHGIFHHPWDPH